MNIGFSTSVFFNNIGNAFIDYGAEYQLRQVMPCDSQFIKLSQCANFSASLSTKFAIKELPGVEWLWTRTMQRFVHQLHDKTYKAVSTLDVLSPAKIAKLDYLVIPGCVLTVPFFVIFGKFLEEKIAQGCKIVFLGASGNYYTEEEQKCVREWLMKINPHAILFRDSKAYEYYHDCCGISYNGIDNVWFVNRLEVAKCPTTYDPYVVLNFDLPKNRGIKKELAKTLTQKGLNIIETDHKPFPYSKVGKLARRNVICSDYPYDYLFLYKNVCETYTDRVHASIPTLAFGNKAQIFSDSPRISLFENVNIDINELKDHPVSINLEALKLLQDEQIKFLSKIFNS